MKNLRNYVLLALFAVMAVSFTACGSEAEAASPLAGNWNEVTGTEKKGMTVEIQADGDKVMVHTAPRADGGHDHISGTYTFDAKTKAVTVKAKLMGDGKGDTWTGTLDGDNLELGSADTKLKLKRGEPAEGH